MKGVDFFGGFSSGNALSRLSESEREISLGALGIFLTKGSQRDLLGWNSASWIVSQQHFNVLGFDATRPDSLRPLYVGERYARSLPKSGEALRPSSITLSDDPRLC